MATFRYGPVFVILAIAGCAGATDPSPMATGAPAVSSTVERDLLGGRFVTESNASDSVHSGAANRIGRPANVPAEYVRTPMGYSHPSCVIGVRKGEIVLKSGGIRQMDGSIRAVDPCKYPVFDAHGNEVHSRIPTNTTIMRDGIKTAKAGAGIAWPNCPNGGPCVGVGGMKAPFLPDYFSLFYVDEDCADKGCYPNVKSIIGTWTVPDLPANEATDGYNFIWNGIASSYGEVLQPVLQFNQTEFTDPCGQTFAWNYSIESWDYRNDSNYYTSCAQEVHPGDQIQGFAEFGAGGYYTIWAKVNGLWTNAWLNGYAAVQMDQYVGGILEVHNFRYNPGCQELPGGYGGYTTTNEVFSSIQVLDIWGDDITPTAWSEYARSDIACNLSVGAEGNWGVLSWYDL